MLIQQGFAGHPGISAALESIEMDPMWGAREVNRTWVIGAILSGTARDLYDSGDGVAEQTTLRPGLLMQYIIGGPETGKWRQWVDDGSQDIGGVMLWHETTQRAGADFDRWFGYILVGGQIRVKGIVIFGDGVDPPATGTDYGNLVGYNELSTEAQVRAGLAAAGFHLDDYHVEIGVDLTPPPPP